MSTRSATETIILLLQAFLRQRTWNQAALARELGVSPRALRQRLAELESAGVPLEREEELPAVWWSVPRGWFPGGAFVSSTEAQQIASQLARLPPTPTRRALVRRLSTSATGRADDESPSSSVTASAGAAVRDEKHLTLVEDGIAAQLALRIHYVSANGGTVDWRTVSPLRIDRGPPARFVAVCHRVDALRWFRLDAILDGHADREGVFRHRPRGDVAAFVATSVGTFREDGTPVECAFVVRDPDARWVAKNLLRGMHAERVRSGLRVTAATTGVLRIARFVVGLGGAATVETPELAARVAALAQAALDSGAPHPPRVMPESARGAPSSRRPRSSRSVASRRR